MKRKKAREPREVARQSPAVHHNFFLKRDQIEVAESILPGSLERMLDSFEKQQAHDNDMDRALIEIHKTQQRLDSSDSWKSFAVVVIFGVVLAMMLFKGMLKEAMAFGGFFVALGGLAIWIETSAGQSTQIGRWMVFSGVALFVGTKARIWWHHG